MKELVPYVARLERQLSDLRPLGEQWASWCDACLDGEPARTLREVVHPADLKAHGAFFTSSRLAAQAARLLGVPEGNRSVYLDPSCGAGDLLLAVAERLPVARTVPSTLALWGRHLCGCDRSSAFVRIARARLALLAMRRCGVREPITASALRHLLPSIATGNALDSSALYASAQRIIMNPPFFGIPAPDGCTWSTGLTNAAALFTEAAIVNCANDTRIVSVLPDVIRSGTRYQRWRSMVAEDAHIEQLVTYGMFDQYAGIDVFLLCLTTRSEARPDARREWTIRNDRGTETVSNNFRVRVGSVVPHRDRTAGPKYPFVQARSLSPWSIGPEIVETRRYSGTVFRPPFVAVRRTSSPRDRKRAVATVVLGTSDVAVENHLLVCQPLDQSIARCCALLARLRNPMTDTWLNQRIRCRHLTVSVVREIPWWEIP